MHAVIVIGLVVIAVAGTIVSVRTTARSGMPSKEVLERAAQRSRELDAREKTEQSNRSD